MKYEKREAVAKILKEIDEFEKELSDVKAANKVSVRYWDHIYQDYWIGTSNQSRQDKLAQRFHEELVGIIEDIIDQLKSELENL